MNEPQAAETHAKLDRLRAWMTTAGYDAVILRRTASLAWITTGATTYVNTANGEGPVTAVVTADRQILLTNTIEGPRIVEEEHVADLGWEVRRSPWFESAATPTHADILGRAVTADRIASDTSLPGTTGVGGEISRLRSRLLPVEVERFRLLAAECANVMNAAVRSTQPGQSEYEIAAHLWAAAQPRGIQVIVNLIATDERIRRYRHPLPTTKTLDRHALLVMCGRRDGLVASVSRIVHFGPVPEEIQRAQDAVAHVDAAAISASRPGRTLGDVFGEIQRAYADAGFPDGWQGHHQGGVAAYEPREYLALPNNEDVLEPGMVCAWNPSLPGAKSEDSVIVGGAATAATGSDPATAPGFDPTTGPATAPGSEPAPDVVTAIPHWPMIETATIPRPGILVR